MTWQWWLPPAIHRRVIVNKSDGSALIGVLWRQHGAWLVLRQAEYVEPNAPPKHVDGEVLVHREKVEFIQVLP